MKARIVVQEMTDLRVLDLVSKELVMNQIVLTVGYDIQNLKNPEIRKAYHGEVTTDYYGRSVPKYAHGTINLEQNTSSTKLIMQAVMELFDRIADKKLLVRRLNITANNVVSAESVTEEETFEQLNLFADYDALQTKQTEEKAELAWEKKLQEAMLEIKQKFGKNAILKGINLMEGATTLERNKQIGGYKA